MSDRATRTGKLKDKMKELKSDPRVGDAVERGARPFLQQTVKRRVAPDGRSSAGASTGRSARSTAAGAAGQLRTKD